MTDADLIAALGGPSAVAGRLPAVNASAITMWRKRGIPARYWPAMQALAAEAQVRWQPPAPSPAPAPERAA